MQMKVERDLTNFEVVLTNEVRLDSYRSKQARNMFILLIFVQAKSKINKAKLLKMKKL